MIADPTLATPVSWSRRGTLIAFVAVVVVGFAVYANTLDNGFTQDDHLLIETNRDIADWDGWTRVFTTDFFARSQGADAERNTSGIGYYRPITRLSWMVDHARAGYDAGAFHVTSVMLHALTSGFVFLLALLLLRSPIAALATGLFFAVHPGHTEAVNVITARSDVLAGLFFVAGAWAYTRALREDGPGRWGFVGLAAIALALACGAKEVGIALLPTAVALELALARESGWRARLRSGAMRLLPLVVVAVTYLAVRSAILDGLAQDRGAFEDLGFAYLWGLPVALVHYLGLHFFPVDPSLAYSVYIAEGLDGRWALSVGLLLMLAAALIAVWRRGHRLPLVFAAILVIGQAPSMVFHLVHIPTPEGTIPLADRWLYVPSVGAALTAGWALSLVPERLVGLARGAAAMVLAAFAAITWMRGPVFADDLAMMQEVTDDLLEKDSDDWTEDDRYTINLTLGLSALRAGDPETAVDFLLQVVNEHPHDPKALNNLANAQLRLERYEDVVRTTSAILSTDFVRDREFAHMNRGLAYLRLGDRVAAERDFRRATELRPNLADAWLLGAEAAAARGATDEAIAFLREGLEALPDEPRMLFNLGNLAEDRCEIATGAMSRYLEVASESDQRRRERARAVLERCR